MELLSKDINLQAQGESGPVSPASELLEPSEPLSAPRHTPPILVVDDCRINRRVAVLMLKQLGYTADVVESGREALSAIRAGSYELVFMDVQMPEMNGLEASAKIRQAQAAGVVGFAPGLRIVAYTTNATPEDRAACISAGMDDHLAKPVSPDRMTAILEKYLAACSGG